MRILLVLASLLAIASAAPAQQIPPIEPGTRVRIQLDPHSAAGLTGAFENDQLIGTVTAVRGDTLEIRFHPELGAVAVPLGAVRRLDVSLGVPSRTTSALRTAAYVGALGAVEWPVLNALDDEPLHRSTATAVLFGAGVGIAAGALLGALRPLERWRRVPLPAQVSIAPASRARLGLVLSIRF